MQGALYVILLDLHNFSVKQYFFSHFINEGTEVEFGDVRFDYEATDVSVHSRQCLTSTTNKHTLSSPGSPCLQISLIMYPPDSR